MNNKDQDQFKDCCHVHITFWYLTYFSANFKQSMLFGCILLLLRHQDGYFPYIFCSCSNTSFKTPVIWGSWLTFHEQHKSWDWNLFFWIKRLSLSSSHFSLNYSFSSVASFTKLPFSTLKWQLINSRWPS